MAGLILPHSAAAMYRAAASSFVPTDLVDLAAWYDASDETTITATGTQVTQWDDKSGNANHVTRTASAIFVTGGTENSLNCFTISGAGGTIQDTSNPIIYDNYEIFVVCRPSSVSNKDFFGTNGTTNGHVLAQIGGNVVNTLWTSSGANGATGPTVSASEFLVAHVYVDGTTIFAGKNGSGSTGSVGGTKAGTAQDIVIGARSAGHAYAFEGSLCEVVICDAALSLSDKNSLGNYLADKWGLTWTTMT